MVHGRAQPFATAADSTDWSLHCPSIFTRKQSLADATLKRIARRLRRYVLKAAEPFIVHATQRSERAGQASRSLDLPQPLSVAVAGGVKRAVAESALPPALAKFRGKSDSAVADEPMPTISRDKVVKWTPRLAGLLSRERHGGKAGVAHQVESPRVSSPPGRDHSAVASCLMLANTTRAGPPSGASWELLGGAANASISPDR